MNITRQSETETSQPETADSHITVTGLPRMSRVLARPRSPRVNQRPSSITIDGSTAPSTTPSAKRTAISCAGLLSSPWATASSPQTTVDQATSRRALRCSA